jgi:hypothetical protein
MYYLLEINFPLSESSAHSAPGGDLFILFVCLLFYGTPAPVGQLVPREV